MLLDKKDNTSTELDLELIQDSLSTIVDNEPKVSLFLKAKKQSDFDIAALVPIMKSELSEQKDEINRRWFPKKKGQQSYGFHNFTAATWSGTYTNRTDTNTLVQYSQLLYVEFNALSKERQESLYEELTKDIYTHLLFTWTIGEPTLRVVVKTDCKAPSEQYKYFDQLINHYQHAYGVTVSEVKTTNRTLNQIGDIGYDPNVYYNPKSKCLCTLGNSQAAAQLSNSETWESISPENDGSALANDDLSKTQFHPTHTIELSVETPVNNDESDLQVKIASKNDNRLAPLTRLLAVEKNLKKIASQDIVLSPPLVSRFGIPIIQEGTINLIQGKYGSHKSRLAELFASLMLANSTSTTDFLGFEKRHEPYLVCYIDTERSTKEQFPDAIKRISRNAGYTSINDAYDFRFTSIKDEDRANRLEVIKTFLVDIRQSTTKHLFVVVDVVTDCIRSFNDASEAMKLNDFFGSLCDSYNSTCLLVIHENPISPKARGHVGTEAANKASTVIQISTQQGNGGSKLIKLQFLKLRGAALPENVYLQFNEEEKGLLVADTELVTSLIDDHSKNEKSNLMEIAQSLGNLLREGPMIKGVVYGRLTNMFNLSDKTVRSKVKQLTEQNISINVDDQQMELIETREGTIQYFQLKIK